MNILKISCDKILINQNIETHSKKCKQELENILIKNNCKEKIYNQTFILKYVVDINRMSLYKVHVCQKSQSPHSEFDPCFKTHRSRVLFLNSSTVLSGDAFTIYFRCDTNNTI